MADHRTLDSPPGALGLYARAAAPLIPGASLLPFVGGRGSDVPDVELRLDAVRIDPEHLAAYSRLCGLRLNGTLPATYPQVLAFPLHMALLTDRRFPFAAVGLVHVANRIVQHRPLGSGERPDLRVTATPVRPHPKGRTFTIRTEALVDGGRAWEAESTMLRRGDGDGSGPRPAPERPESLMTASSTWRLPGDLGRRYAAVSGDHNPIHLYDVTAKLLGFPRAIAHGMWTKARALAALEGRLPDAFAVDVRFRKPVLLPATVTFGSETQGPDIRFAVQDARKGTPHLAGTITHERTSP